MEEKKWFIVVVVIVLFDFYIQERKKGTNKETNIEERTLNCFQIISFEHHPGYDKRQLTFFRILYSYWSWRSIEPFNWHHLQSSFWSQFNHLIQKARSFDRTVNFLNSLNGLTLSTKNHENLSNWLQDLSNHFHSLEGKLLTRE